MGPDLVEVYNFCYRHGRLCKSQRQGAITILYKKGDCLDLANWRPITLLCVDYKIAAKVLGNRLLQVIALVVSPDQSCGIPGWSPAENVRLLLDVACYADQNNIGGTILSLDQEKAFDRVEISFLLKVLERMGFGPSFRNWIGLLYTDVHSAVSVNGFLTEFFPVTRGVRQGCPLSPLLYVLVMESLASAVRADIHINGFPLPGGNNVVKISQYADDTSSFVCSDASLRALFGLFAKYERASGARLNQGKCQGLLLGPCRTSFPVDLKWKSSYIEVLGARISPDGYQDWEPALKALDNVFLSWQHRRLSYRGRALVACMLGISRFWYLGSTLPVSSDLAPRITRSVFAFVWNNKREWLSRSSASLPLSQGGLGVVNIASKLASLRVMSVKSFLVGGFHPWKCFFRHFLRRAFLSEPVKHVFDFKSVGSSTLCRLPLFYHQVLAAWLLMENRDNIENLTSKIAYGQIQPVASHRCVAKLAEYQLDWPALWQDLNIYFVNKPIWKTNFLLLHGILPTANRLARWGIEPWHKHCHCGQLESHEHLFEHCPLTLILVDWFEELLGRKWPDYRLSNAHIRFGHPASAGFPVGFKVLLATLRHYV